MVQRSSGRPSSEVAFVVWRWFMARLILKLAFTLSGSLQFRRLQNNLRK